MSFALKNVKKKKKSEKYNMRRNSRYRVSSLRSTHLHISSPSLYQHSYNSMFSFLKLQISRRVTGQSVVCRMVYMGTLSSRNTTQMAFCSYRDTT
jgi:hypothetical protein